MDASRGVTTGDNMARQPHGPWWFAGACPRVGPQLCLNFARPVPLLTVVTRGPCVPSAQLPLERRQLPPPGELVCLTTAGLVPAWAAVGVYCEMVFGPNYGVACRIVGSCGEWMRELSPRLPSSRQTLGLFLKQVKKLTADRDGVDTVQ
jgi:hypothetical protein